MIDTLFVQRRDSYASPALRSFTAVCRADAGLPDAA